jgi:hypothetical protein
VREVGGGERLRQQQTLPYFSSPYLPQAAGALANATVSRAPETPRRRARLQWRECDCLQKEGETTISTHAYPRHHQYHRHDTTTIIISATTSASIVSFTIPTIADTFRMAVIGVILNVIAIAASSTSPE